MRTKTFGDWPGTTPPILPAAFKSDFASTYTGFSESTLKRLTSLGVLPVKHIGRHRFYLRTDLDALLSKSVEQLEAISHQLALISRRYKKQAVANKNLEK